MSTQMKIVQEPEGWVVLNAGRPVAIAGTVHRDSREALVAEIVAKELFVFRDGTISKTPETDLEPLVVSGYTPDPAPPTEDPPVDPGSRPGADPNPTVPINDPEPADELPLVGIATEVGFEEKSFGDAPAGSGVGNEVEVPIVRTAKSRARRPISNGVTEKVAAEQDILSDASRLGESEKPKRTRKPRAPKTEKVEGERFTPEQKAARAEYAKKYRQQMTDEQKERAKERARERQKKWRENHPDKAADYAKVSSERRKERYNEDPEYRASYREKQKAYALLGKSPETVG